jgi:hypothetical protein
MRLSAVAATVGLCFAALASAEEPKPPPPAPAEPQPAYTFAMHGFIGGTLFVQDAALRPGEGGQALWVSPQTPSTTLPNIGGRQPNTDVLVLSGDVRQTRLNLSLAGPKVLEATPKGVVEIDFFGGFAGGPSGDASVLPRLRHAYAELEWGQHKLQFGQMNDLLIAQIPVSLAHLGNPLGFASGMLGWRRPAVFGYHTLGDRKDLYVELAWEVGRSTWNYSFNGNVAGAGDRFGFQAGEASGLPAIEARVTVGQGTQFTGFAVGHWSRIDRTGVDAQSTPANGINDLDVVAGEIGGKAVFGPLTVLVEGFSGKNLAPVQGAFGQIQPVSAQDVHEFGAYVQAGVNFTPELSLWGYIGTDKIDQPDAVAANFGVIQNTISYGLLQYRYKGYALGLEWDHYFTRTRNNVAIGGVRDASLDGNLSGNKVSLNGIYFF